MADTERDWTRTEVTEFERVANSESWPREDSPGPSALTAHDNTRLERVERATLDIVRDVSETKTSGQIMRLTQQRQEITLQQINAAVQMLIGKVDALAGELAKDRAAKALEQDGHCPA